jgi:hypothetical protein
MVRANQRFDLACAFLAKPHGAVRTAIFKNIDLSPPVADHDHRPLPHAGALERASLRHFHLQANIAPVTTVEDPFQLALVDLQVGVDRRRDAAEAAVFPRRLQSRR